MVKNHGRRRRPGRAERGEEPGLPVDVPSVAFGRRPERVHSTGPLLKPMPRSISPRGMHTSEPRRSPRDVRPQQTSPRADPWLLRCLVGSANCPRIHKTLANSAGKRPEATDRSAIDEVHRQEFSQSLGVPRVTTSGSHVGVTPETAAGQKLGTAMASSPARRPAHTVPIEA